MTISVYLTLFYILLVKCNKVFLMHSKDLLRFLYFNFSSVLWSFSKKIQNKVHESRIITKLGWSFNRNEANPILVFEAVLSQRKNSFLCTQNWQTLSNCWKCYITSKATLFVWVFIGLGMMGNLTAAFEVKQKPYRKTLRFAAVVKFEIFYNTIRFYYESFVYPWKVMGESLLNAKEHGKCKSVNSINRIE